MKARIFLITLVIAVSGSFVCASAQNISNEKSVDISNQLAKISIDENNLVAVSYHDISDKDRRKLSVCIYDDYGYLVNHYGLIKRKKAIVRFDMSHLPDGNYNFGVYKKDELVCSKVITNGTQDQSGVTDGNYMVNK